MDRLRYLLPVLALLPALWLWWIRSSAPPPEPVPHVVQPARPAPPPAAAVKVAEVKKGKPIAAREQGKYDFAKVPEDNVIPFRVVGNSAIAYGDVLLGEPDDSGIKEGVYDAPTPRLWDRGDIPYAISPKLPHPERVEAAIRYLQENTAVTFVALNGQQDGILFEPTEEHCYSLLGKHGGIQPIRLAAGCQRGEILHELMHALGFVHEQSRTDRDRYVKIHWENIDDKFRDQFAIVPESFMEATRGFSFDFNSTMLYRADIFARQPTLPTMQSLLNTTINPVADGLSAGDIERVNALYKR